MDSEILSKTRRKRAMHELQALGAELVELSAPQLAGLNLPESLADAVRAAQTIASRQARRRQLQLIGRLMRDVDPAPIREQLARVRGESGAARAWHQRLEQWRERLLANDEALTDFAHEHPAADLQAIRTAVRNARHEQAAGRPPRAFRALFRLLRVAAGGEPVATQEVRDAA